MGIKLQLLGYAQKWLGLRQQTSVRTAVIAILLFVLSCVLFLYITSASVEAWIQYFSSDEKTAKPTVGAASSMRFSDWGKITYYLASVFICFHARALKSINGLLYLKFGFLSYALLIATIGGLMLRDGATEEYWRLGHLWAIVLLCGFVWFTASWTGFWSSLPNTVKLSGVIVAGVALFVILVSGALNITNTFGFSNLLLLLLAAIAFYWIGRFFLEKPAKRAFASVLLFFMGATLVITYLGLDQPRLLSGWVGEFPLLPEYPAHMGLFFLLLTGRVEQISRPNLQLEAQLKAREEELALSRAALEEETKKRVLLEERDRLVRDVHDGIGGQMLSMLVRLRSGKLADKAVEQELEDCLTDLRMIVDSLDASSEEFSAAMTAFCHRATEQLEAANVQLVWRQEENTLENVHFDVAATLNISRFLQEAVTNVIRHARASQMSIQINKDSLQNVLRFTVQDDGCGIVDIEKARAAGKGLRNLQKRAHALNAKLSVSPSSDRTGFKLVLSVPVR